MIRKWLAVLVCALCISETASAQNIDLGPIGKAALPEDTGYAEVPAKYGADRLVQSSYCRVGQLQIIRNGKYMTAWVIVSAIPEPVASGWQPYFHINLNEQQLMGLGMANMELYASEPAVSRYIGEMVSRWAASKHLELPPDRIQTKMSGIDPIRRMNGLHDIVYTAGARICVSADGFIFPLAVRAYLFDRDSNLYMLGVLTGDTERFRIRNTADDIVKSIDMD